MKIINLNVSESDDNLLNSSDILQSTLTRAYLLASMLVENTTATTGIIEVNYPDVVLSESTNETEEFDHDSITVNGTKLMKPYLQECATDLLDDLIAEMVIEDPHFSMTFSFEFENTEINEMAVYVNPIDEEEDIDEDEQTDSQDESDESGVDWFPVN
jgi:hypothetical protein